jgi:hypothetical protein
MATPIQDFGRVLRAIFRFARLASYGLIGVMVVFLAFRVAEVFDALADVHVALGWAFLALFAAAAWFLVGRPVYRFLRVPVAIRPPTFPPPAERTPRHLVRHLDFVERYVEGLRANPEWPGTPDEVDAAVAACRALRERATRAARADLDALSREVAALERDVVGALLQPLDKKVNDVIRAEALGVGIATAISLNGTIDAFIVLWRNCNMVSRIANVYYGRPGPRGSLRILRDVSVATLASAYAQDLSEAAGGMLGGLLGKTAGVFAGPVLDGSVNAICTLRIGYLAKARCRSFQAWNERTRLEAVRYALGEAAALSTGLVADILKSVGGGLLRLPGKILGGMGSVMASLLRWTADKPPAPEGASGA